ncbi:MAG: glycoside hydrolase family 31 protein [Saprospiraceae bacterium]|nr:glycoside hydrolase family 31 protein [Saprospiraceae bacterium]
MKARPAPQPEEKPETPREIDFAAASVSLRYDDVFQWIYPNEVSDVRWRDGAYEFVCHNGVALRVSVWSAGIFRLRYSPDGVFQPDFSYSIDPSFEPEKVTVRLEEREGEYLLDSGALQVVVSKLDLKVKFYDQDDRVLCEDEGGYAARRTIMNGWCEFIMEKKCHRKEVFYGLGDKSCGVNLSGKKFENWCTDAYGFGRDTDPLYRAVPFYYALHAGVAYGIFFDNSFKTHFDFDSQEKGVTTFRSEGGELNYYFLYGPGLNDVARSYARLTGVHELPPMWTLGYHQCRWSYYPESRVRAIAREFRQRNIPCDALYLDIDYMDGYRCFTWDQKAFPAPRQLAADLKADGFQTVCMIDPGIKEDPAYSIYADGVENNRFIRTADGAIAKGPVWPGFCAFPDFTHPDVREWWGTLYTSLYCHDEIAGFWNDMNEPAVFHVNHKTLPDQVMHHHDGHWCSHKKAHNIYGLQMNRASWEGLKKLRPEKRPFLLSRASFSGGQRFSAIWTGDNCSDWEHLQIANIQCQRLAISGFSFCGTDIGGFTGCTDGELYVRWLQLGVFHPFMRTHSKGQHSGGDFLLEEESDHSHPGNEPVGQLPVSQEPWSFGVKWEQLAKKAIELRYCLLPCLYSAMWLHTLDGTPVLRHLAFADSTDPKLLETERDFLFGEHILVSPIVQSKIQRQGVYLPKGNWYYFWTGQPAAGELFISVIPEEIPFFVREGAVLPVYPNRQHTGEPVTELTLYVYYKNGLETSHLYEDAGEGYAHLAGEFCLKIFETEGKNGNFSLRQRKEGTFMPAYGKVKVYLVGFPAFVRKCMVDGAEIPIKEIKLRDRSLYTLTLQPNFEKVEWEG